MEREPMNVVTPDGELVYRLESPKPAKPWWTWGDVWRGVGLALLVGMATLV